MAYLNDNVYDSGLAWATANGSRIDLCTTDPVGVYATVTANTAANAAVTVGAAQNGDIDGRKVVVPAITDGNITATATATHWALTNGTDTVVASGVLSGSVSLTTGNFVTLNAINIALRDAT